MYKYIIKMVCFTHLLYINMAYAASNPSLGHSIIGWLIQLVYLFGAWRCFDKGQRSKFYGGNYHYWYGLAALFICFLIGRELNVIPETNQYFRSWARAGAYEQVNLLYTLFTVLLFGGLALTLYKVRLYLINSWHKYRLTWLGLLFLGFFVLLRLVAIQEIDKVLDYTIAGIKLSEVWQLGALLVMLVGTYSHYEVSQFTPSKLSEIDTVVEIKKEGEFVRCPQCGKQPLAKTRDGRKFKCKGCGLVYSVHISSTLEN